mgnify:CR=1 FL=1
MGATAGMFLPCRLTVSCVTLQVGGCGTPGNSSCNARRTRADWSVQVRSKEEDDDDEEKEEQKEEKKEEKKDDDDDDEENIDLTEERLDAVVCRLVAVRAATSHCCVARN